MFAEKGIRNGISWNLEMDYGEGGHSHTESSMHEHRRPSVDFGLLYQCSVILSTSMVPRPRLWDLHVSNSWFLLLLMNLKNFEFQLFAASNSLNFLKLFCGFLESLYIGSTLLLLSTPMPSTFLASLLCLGLPARCWLRVGSGHPRVGPNLSGKTFHLLLCMLLAVSFFGRCSLSE